MPDNPLRKWTDLFLQKFERRIGPHVHEVPAAQFHIAQLRMLVCVPVHISPTFEGFIIPLEQFEIIFHGMFTIPVDELEFLDARLFHRTPKFHRP